MLARLVNWFREDRAIIKKKRPTRTHRVPLGCELLERRDVPATLRVGATETYHTIQAAVNAAAATTTVADTILIDAGTYNEQVVIPSSINTTNSLVINAASLSNKPTIKPTVALSMSMAIVDVNGATGVTLENVIIDGSGTSTAWFGVFVENGGNATIQSNTIQNVTATASSGQDTGFGIRVGRNTLSGQAATTGTATISNNTITGYGKGGIDVANTGSSATINGNTVTGLGHKVSDNIQQVQNGIEIDDGANGLIGTTLGNTVSKNGSAQTGFGSAGILLYQPGSGVKVGGSQGGNSLSNNDVGIWVFDAASPTISNNNVSGSLYFGIAFDTAGGAGVTGANVNNNNSNNNTGDGFNIAATSNSTFTGNHSDSNNGNGFVLYGKDTGNTITQGESKSNQGYGFWVVYNDTTNSSYAATYGINSNTGNTITSNTFTGNHQTDAFDQSVGSGTAGTADTWRTNTLGTKNPSGLS
jgi:parallel beta-helix repeat protein